MKITNVRETESGFTSTEVKEMTFDSYDINIVLTAIKNGQTEFDVKEADPKSYNEFPWGDEVYRFKVTHRLTGIRTKHFEIHDYVERERYVSQQFVEKPYAFDPTKTYLCNTYPKTEKYVALDNRIYADVTDNGEIMTITWQVNDGKRHHGILTLEHFPSEHDIKDYVRYCIGYHEDGITLHPWGWEHSLNEKDVSYFGKNID